MKIPDNFDLIKDCSELSDQFILNNILNKNGNINGNKVTQSYLEKHIILKEYLYNRYADSNTIKETIYRMKNSIEIRPVCKQCGNPVKFKQPSTGYSMFCCAHCATINEETKEKLRQTNLKKYGVEHNWQSPECREKCKKTSKERYGNENNYKKILQTTKERYGEKYPLQNQQIIKKVKETCISKYGQPSIFLCNEYKEKIKQTMIEKYGVDNPAKSDEIKNKTKETNIKKYGFPSPLQNNKIHEKSIKTQKQKYNGLLYVQTDQFKNIIQEKHDIIEEKKYNTHKKNKTFNSSKIEKLFNQYLQDNYNNNFYTQYKSDLYPFKCDFYIKSLNLYIEIQAYWMHNKHPFDPNNIIDQKILCKWKEKNSLKYNQAIDTWTIRDVKKRNTAKENNLNYLEIFSNDINDCILQLNNYINKNYNM